MILWHLTYAIILLSRIFIFPPEIFMKHRAPFPCSMDAPGLLYALTYLMLTVDCIYLLGEAHMRTQYSMAIQQTQTASIIDRYSLSPSFSSSTNGCVSLATSVLLSRRPTGFRNDGNVLSVMATVDRRMTPREMNATIYKHIKQTVSSWSLFAK